MSSSKNLVANPFLNEDAIHAYWPGHGAEIKHGPILKPVLYTKRQPQNTEDENVPDVHALMSSMFNSNPYLYFLYNLKQ